MISVSILALINCYDLLYSPIHDSSWASLCFKTFLLQHNILRGIHDLNKFGISRNFNGGCQDLFLLAGCAQVLSFETRKTRIYEHFRTNYENEMVTFVIVSISSRLADSFLQNRWRHWETRTFVIRVFSFIFETSHPGSTFLGKHECWKIRWKWWKWL
jgi:hypothetical protein